MVSGHNLQTANRVLEAATALLKALLQPVGRGRGCCGAWGRRGEGGMRGVPWWYGVGLQAVAQRGCQTFCSVSPLTGAAWATGLQPRPNMALQSLLGEEV